MQAVSVDIEDWEAALRKIRVSEPALLFLINERLRTRGRYLDCQISALRYVDGLDRNWEVAAFVLGPVDTPDFERRLAQIGAFIARASDGMDVDWPSIANH